MENNRWQIVAGLKIGVVVLVILVAGLFFLYQRKQARINQVGISSFSRLMGQATNDEILVIPYQQTLYKHFGNAINPQVKLAVKTIGGYQDMEFLIDSGAVVSALPKLAALDLGTDLDNLPRITIEGFAEQKTFAYRGEFVVKIGPDEIVLPVVFSENPQASNILGRIGFFDQFNVVFNADDRNITISRRTI
ncbi:hypothetical protein COW80_00085 [Candidatus Beckwithbacteria bacterium CG22_combo_CG10-13_8_21_14_all_01_47_9]|uniref:Peptidase A2 domain-containing protein n=4 Tax=Candidatus Beckwithiibacteriota TaxID=1752726 RepID=A0A2H0E232_9BACT|nr:MAG: hypothetical protein AUJ59_00250 [Candidatus Beckwithbacteria bacterium CG1_02_47_37]PIP88492.1 MAG: hypothetical protein COW80_00085 [Candidatus Beckwithbacteria bacterium CG22_combo_CG10-13_8_21_14_all_01_47_9]PJA22848.1 MAG: hypothetical protein COX59_01965 [Candidatus Beckwithbacteria bacterium CG_4_10_14_0_2_um_filter_47_25]PJC66635.1 MAG: hypothetical protein CO018_00950 [Candidatus Beckwithbacteria bacterium CG_4_9_14_0_2_um_filter_47_11]